MQMAGAARSDALLFGITTPGYDLTSLAHSLYQEARAGGKNLFAYLGVRPGGGQLTTGAAWKIANPCYDRPGFADAMEFDRERLPEHEFRRFRLGQWTATETAWLPYGKWDEARGQRRRTPRRHPRVDRVLTGPTPVTPPRWSDAPMRATFG